MARDQDFEATVAKCTKLLRQFQASDAKATLQTEFKDVRELDWNGYEKHEGGAFEIECTEDAIRELGVDDKMEEDGEDSIRTYHIHDYDSLINGVVYHVSNLRNASRTRTALN
jgi:hypothetical protein